MGFIGTTKVVPCYKAPELEFFRSLFSRGNGKQALTLDETPQEVTGCPKHESSGST